MDMTVSPAYGKDYTTAKDAIAAWNSGKDFIIRSVNHPYRGMYVSRWEVANETLVIPTVETVYIRYNKETAICKVKGTS
jgi:hypothetical protein